MAATPSQTESAVVCSNITRQYTDEGGLLSDRGEVVIALDSVSLNVSAGEVVGVAGPSGSGKSTLLHLLAALDTPTAGTIEIRDTNIATLSGREQTRFRRNNIGMVFQRFHLLPALTARENVALPLVQAGKKRSTRRKRAEELLEAVGLGDRTTHRPGALSGGEQQRVAIARALAADPALVIADEPTGEWTERPASRCLIC